MLLRHIRPLHHPPQLRRQRRHRRLRVLSRQLRPNCNLETTAPR